MYSKLSIITVSEIGFPNIQHAHGSFELSVCCANLDQHWSKQNIIESNDLPTKKHTMHSKAKCELGLGLSVPCFPHINAELKLDFTTNWLALE